MVLRANYRLITAPRAIIQEAGRKMRDEGKEKVTFYRPPIMLIRQNDKGE